MIDAVAELAALFGLCEIREPELDPLLDHVVQTAGEEGGEQRLLVGGQAQGEHAVGQVLPDEHGRFGHLPHQGAATPDRLGAAGHEAGRHAGQHGTGERALTEDPLAGRDHGERARGGDAKCMHGLADEVLAQHRSQGGPAIATAREGGEACALELEVAQNTVASCEFSEQDGAPVT